MRQVEPCVSTAQARVSVLSHGGVDGRPDSLEAEIHLSRCWTGPAHSSSTRLAAAMAVRRRAAACQTFGGMPFRASAAQVNSVLVRKVLASSNS